MQKQPGKDDDAPMLLEPSAAIKQLGISHSGLRRLGQLYEQVHGELPRKDKGSDKGNTRLWPTEAIERLKDARLLLEQGRYGSIVEALEALQRGETPNDAPDWLEAAETGSQAATEQALRLLIDEVKGQRSEIAALRSELAELRLDTTKQLEVAPRHRAGPFAGLLRRWRRVRAALVEKEDT